MSNTTFFRADGCSGGNWRCDWCGVAWDDHIFPGSRCPAPLDAEYQDTFDMPEHQDILDIVEQLRSVQAPDEVVDIKVVIELRAEIKRLRDELLEAKGPCESPCRRGWELIKEIERLRAALRRYADPMNWGYYDDSGCDKGHGISTDACFLGPMVAKEALGDE